MKLWELYKRPEVKAALRKWRKANANSLPPHCLSGDELELVRPFIEAEAKKVIAKVTKTKLPSRGGYIPSRSSIPYRASA